MADRSNMILGLWSQNLVLAINSNISFQFMSRTVSKLLHDVFINQNKSYMLGQTAAAYVSKTTNVA